MTVKEYFEAEEFKRFIELCKEKYISLSGARGTIVLKNANRGEKFKIGALLGKVFETDDLKISLKSVDKALMESRFSISLKELLLILYDNNIMTKAEKAEAEQEGRNGFFYDICDKYSDDAALGWIKYMIKEHRIFIKRYNEDKSLLMRDIDYVCKALNMMGKPQLLPVFGAEVSGDPHMFDDNTSCGQMLNYLAMYITQSGYPKNSSERNDLLEKIGLYSDMVSSFVYCKNIRLYDNRGEHLSYKIFLERNEAFTLNIGNLLDIQKAEAVKNKVYIVENPAVFTILAMSKSDASVICTAGQPKNACIRLLNLLDDTEMYYSGDFDMGGINIADRLLKLYKNMKPWHYEADDYRAAVSNNKLSDTAIGSLKKVDNGMLKNTVACMIRTGYAGYQENIVRALTDDLK